MSLLLITLKGAQILPTGEQEAFHNVMQKFYSLPGFVFWVLVPQSTDTDRATKRLKLTVC